MHYPKFKYHKAHGPKVVHSAEAEANLGQGWHDTPAAFGIETCPAKKPDEAIAARKAPAPAQAQVQASQAAKRTELPTVEASMEVPRKTLRKAGK